MTPSIQEPIALNPEPALAADFVLPPRPTITLGRLAACWDRWVLVALALVVGAGATHGQEPDKKYAKEVAWSLKGEPANRPPLTLMGPDAEQCVRFEPAGLRIVLPNGHPPARPVIGLRVPLEIKGDFEITMSFAILQEPRPADTGFGARITLSVHTSVAALAWDLKAWCAVAMNIKSGDARLVLLCPAWKKWGTVKTVKPNTVILHSRADDVVPFANSEELVRKSGLPASALIEVGNDHRLTDPEPLEAMLRACQEWSPMRR